MGRKKQTAYHEAGHAVIGRVLTLPCGRATIRSDDDSAGHAITPDPYACLYQWEKRGKVRNSQNAVWVARIITYMAGAEAEVEFLGKVPQDDDDDRYQISLMMEEIAPSDWERYEARLRRMTRMLVRPRRG
jgi:ATP-dependent Zn protease